jgi:hypothetical protein
MVHCWDCGGSPAHLPTSLGTGMVLSAAERPVPALCAADGNRCRPGIDFATEFARNPLRPHAGSCAEMPDLGVLIPRGMAHSAGHCAHLIRLDLRLLAVTPGVLSGAGGTAPPRTPQRVAGPFPTVSGRVTVSP